MTVQEIKKLTPHEFAERYPFLHWRKWDPDKREYYKAYWEPEDDAVKSGYHKVGEPVMEVYQDDFYGWNILILCWVEKVREVFINNGDGKIPEDVFITDIKEKYGTLRISFNYGSYFKPPYEKIDDLTHMAEHLSKYCCYQCGHIGRSSNEKKLVSYRTGGWISYQCKNVQRKKLGTILRRMELKMNTSKSVYIQILTSICTKIFSIRTLQGLMGIGL